MPTMPANVPCSTHIYTMCFNCPILSLHMPFLGNLFLQQIFLTAVSHLMFKKKSPYVNTGRTLFFQPLFTSMSTFFPCINLASATIKLLTFTTLSLISSSTSSCLENTVPRSLNSLPPFSPHLRPPHTFFAANTITL